MSRETPVPSHELHERLVSVEDAAQEFRFIHLVKTDAQTAGMGVLYSQQQRIQQELSGFRAEVAAELETVKNDLAAVKDELTAVKDDVATVRAEQARQGEMLAEILRRLS